MCSHEGLLKEVFTNKGHLIYCGQCDAQQAYCTYCMSAQDHGTECYRCKVPLDQSALDNKTLIAIQCSISEGEYYELKKSWFEHLRSVILRPGKRQRLNHQQENTCDNYSEYSYKETGMCSMGLFSVDVSLVTQCVSVTCALLTELSERYSRIPNDPCVNLITEEEKVYLESYYKENTVTIEAIRNVWSNLQLYDKHKGLLHSLKYTTDPLVRRVMNRKLRDVDLKEVEIATLKQALRSCTGGQTIKQVQRECLRKCIFTAFFIKQEFNK